MSDLNRDSARSENRDCKPAMVAGSIFFFSGARHAVLHLGQADLELLIEVIAVGHGRGRSVVGGGGILDLKI